MIENITINAAPEEDIASLLTLVGKPARIKILMVIREKAACVCHLEAALGLRQASISQHLMTMRKAGLVDTTRERRNIFYRLVRPELVDILERAAVLTGSDLDTLRLLSRRPVSGCSCPQCNPALDPRLTCRPKK